jgi:hypothetical protein
LRENSVRGCLVSLGAFLSKTGLRVLKSLVGPSCPNRNVWLFVLPRKCGYAHLPLVDSAHHGRGSTRRRAQASSFPMTLDEAIRIALENSEVIRVLGGTSGRTVYDPAIANTQIDRARARFDPSFAIQNRFNNNRIPVAEPTARLRPAFPSTAIASTTTTWRLGCRRRTRSAECWPRCEDESDPSGHGRSVPAQSQSRSTVDFRATQPLLQGAGRRANLTPIVLARIDTERSFYSLKLSVQRLVQSVVDAYWSLWYFARTDRSGSSTTNGRGRMGCELADANMTSGRGIAASVLSPRLSRPIYNFRAAQISAEAAVLQREQVASGHSRTGTSRRTRDRRQSRLRPSNARGGRLALRRSDCRTESLRLDRIETGRGIRRAATATGQKHGAASRRRHGSVRIQRPRRTDTNRRLPGWSSWRFPGWQAGSRRLHALGAS